MKYALLFLCLTAMTACNAKPDLYVCANPEMMLQSVTIPANSKGLKDLGSRLQITTNVGNIVTLPKSLCMEVRRAKVN